MAFRILFQHVSESLPLAKAMLGKRSHIAMAIQQHYKKRFRGTTKDGLALKYLSHAGAAAVSTLLASWVDDGLPLTVEEIPSRCEGLLDGIFLYTPTAPGRTPM